MRVEDGRYRIWYGGQGRDGHDRIRYAESADELRWDRKGVAVQGPTANHVNAPSVVRAADGTYFMYFTRAGKSVVDEIALATSADGLTWATRGTVLSPGRPDEWDGLSVGRPSAVVEDGVFKLWYDGRRDLPPGAPAKGVPTSPTSPRSVGYATRRDGLQWTKHAGKPVFGHGAGGVDVKRVGGGYAMAYESQEGTRRATSRDGIAWADAGLWPGKSGGPINAFGHVSPFLFCGPDGGLRAVYFGAAAVGAWNRNAVAVERLADAADAGRPGAVGR